MTDPSKKEPMSERNKSLNLFCALVREHAPMLLTYVRTMIDDPGTVDDILQETMIVAWRRFEDYDDSRPLARWLRGIARKLVQAHYSRLGRGPVYCSDSVLRAIDERMVAIDQRREDTWNDKIGALEHCLEHLSEPMRRSIELFYRENWKTEEIAAQMSTTREAVKKRLQRARSLLADCLRGKGVLQWSPQETNP
jgi:RNA polymerase sigma-70 factor (ECF subfamily)